MADLIKQDQKTEDVAAQARVQAEADAAAEKARVEAEEKAKAEAAAAEAAKNDPEVKDEAVSTVKVILDPEFAAALDVDSANVGTAAGEYELTSTPVDVPQTDAENVLASPAAKEAE